MLTLNQTLDRFFESMF